MIADQWYDGNCCSKKRQEKEIRDGASTALNTVYIAYIVYTVYAVHTVYTIQTALNC